MDADAIMKVYVCVCVCNAVAVMKVSMKLDVTLVTLDKEAGRTLTSTLKQSSKPYQVAQHPLQNWGHESVHENRRYTITLDRKAGRNLTCTLKQLSELAHMSGGPAPTTKMGHPLQRGPAPTTKMGHPLQRGPAPTTKMGL